MVSPLVEMWGVGTGAKAGEVEVGIESVSGRLVGGKNQADGASELRKLDTMHYGSLHENLQARNSSSSNAADGVSKRHGLFSSIQRKYQHVLYEHVA